MQNRASFSLFFFFLLIYLWVRGFVLFCVSSFPLSSYPTKSRCNKEDILGFPLNSVLMTCFSSKEEGKHKNFNGKSLSSSVLRRLNITNDFRVFGRCVISTDYECYIIV